MKRNNRESYRRENKRRAKELMEVEAETNSDEVTRGGEEESKEAWSPVFQVFDSKVFSQSFLPYCGVAELKLLRLVSKGFQSSTIGALLSRTRVNTLHFFTEEEKKKGDSVESSKEEERKKKCFITFDKIVHATSTEEPALNALSLLTSLESLFIGQSKTSWGFIESTSGYCLSDGVRRVELFDPLTVSKQGYNVVKKHAMVVPSCLKRITFCDGFSDSIHDLPNTITHLTFGSAFNDYVHKHTLPNSVTHLRFGHNFNMMVNNLPDSVTHLYFGVGFHQPLEHLPPRVVHIELRTLNFTGTLSKLPPSVRVLHLLGSFDDNLEHLPPHLVELYATCYSRVNLDRLPTSLVNLKLYKVYSNTEGDGIKVDKLPDSVLALDLMHNFDDCVDNLPRSLLRLNLGYDVTKNNTENLDPGYQPHDEIGIFNKTIDLLPETITHLSLGDRFDREVKRWPKSLTHLKLGNLYNHFTDNLGEGLKSLEFGHEFNRPVGLLPKSLVRLVFGRKFNQRVDHLPLRLETLAFGNDFNQTVEKLPPSLLDLSFGHLFNRSIDNLPEGIVYLRLSIWVLTITNTKLPKKLVRLTSPCGREIPLKLSPEGWVTFKMGRTLNDIITE